MAMSLAAQMEGVLRQECERYQRRCSVMTSCCGNIYHCRLCHDEKEDHRLKPEDVKQILCLPCGYIQSVHKYCGMCGVRFGEYTCLKCRLYDDEDKGQFHCDDCGICRIGGKERFFHCKKCNLCLLHVARDNHKCVENASRQDCPICMEYMHTSVDVLYIPKCGHLLHEKCYLELKESGRTNCTLCMSEF